MAFRPIIFSPLAPQTSSGGLLTFAPIGVAPGAVSGTSAGRLLSTLSGAVYSVLSGALAVNAATGAVTTTGVAPSSGSISGHVRVQDAANASAEELTIKVPIAVPVVPGAPTVTTAPSLSTSSPKVGTPVTPTPGVYTGSPTVTAQWFYGDTGALISGAPTTSGTAYTPVSADLGHPFKYIETAANGGGSVASAAPTTGAVAATTGILAAIKTDNALASPMAAMSLPAFASIASATRNIIVDATDKKQTMLGFGAALTDSTCNELMNVMTPAQRTAFLQEAFGTNGFNTSRICIGTSDFTAQSAYYSYADNGGTADPNLTSFSIAQDLTYIVPALKAALAVNPNIKFIASPWSPPAWMKNTATLLGQSSGGTTSTFNTTTANFTTYAQYFVKFLQAYAAQGINVYAVTVQNEPNANPATYPGCVWASADMANFVANYLKPALAAASLSTLVFAGDAAWGDTGTFVSGPFASNLASYDGAAYHGYDGSPSKQVSDAAFSGKSIHMTELSTFEVGQPHYLALNTADEQAWMGGVLGVACLRYGASSLTMWNLLLDPSGNPVLASQSKNINPCVSMTTDGNATLSRFPSYWMLAHLAKYVKPGARRVACNTLATLDKGGGGATNVAGTGGDVEAVAFLNPDGSIVAFLFNSAGLGGSTSTPTTETFTLTDAASGLATTVTLNAGDMATVQWTGLGSAAAQPTTRPWKIADRIGAALIDFNPNLASSITYGTAPAVQKVVEQSDNKYAIATATGVTQSPLIAPGSSLLGSGAAIRFPYVASPGTTTSSYKTYGSGPSSQAIAPGSGTAGPNLDGVGNLQVCSIANGVASVSFGGGATPNLSGFPTTQTAYLFEAVWQAGGPVSFYMNGTQVGAAQTSTVVPTAPGSIYAVIAPASTGYRLFDWATGATDFFNRNAGDRPFVGDAGHLVIGSVGDTTSERQYMEGFLLWETGLQSLLPSGHPWAASAPTRTVAA